MDLYRRFKVVALSGRPKKGRAGAQIISLGGNRIFLKAQEIVSKAKALNYIDKIEGNG
jgi:hypothetical protein